MIETVDIQKAREDSPGHTEFMDNDSVFVKYKITIKDTGIGIADDDFNKLFLDFGKLDQSSQRNRQGTGLGLSICNKIINKMGGSIDVRSKRMQGTSFEITMQSQCLYKILELDNEHQQDE